MLSIQSAQSGGPFREELGSEPFETSQLTQQTLSNLISNANPFSNLFKAFSKEEKKFNWMHFRMHAAVVASCDHRFVAI